MKIRLIVTPDACARLCAALADRTNSIHLAYATGIGRAYEQVVQVLRFRGQGHEKIEIDLEVTQIVGSLITPREIIDALFDILEIFPQKKQRV